MSFENRTTAPALSLALQEGVITYSDLEQLEREDSEAAYERTVAHIHSAGTEAYLLNRWQQHHDELTGLSREFTAINIRPYVRGMRTVLRFHLASEGLK